MHKKKMNVQHSTRRRRASTCPPLADSTFNYECKKRKDESQIFRHTGLDPVSSLLILDSGFRRNDNKAASP